MAHLVATAPVEAETEKYRRLYTTLLDAIPSSVLLVDKHSRIVSANRNFFEKSQRTMSNTLGHRLEEVFPPIIMEHTNLREQINQAFEQWQLVHGQRMTYRAPGIPLRTYYYNIVPILCDDTDHQVMLLMEDVTEQVRLSEEVRRMERHLASIVESARDIVLSTDREGRILTWNSAAERLSGFGFQEVDGHFFCEFCREEKFQEMLTLFERIVTGNESHTAEWAFQVRGQNYIPVSWVFSPMLDDQGNTVGVVAVGRDLTEQRKLEMQLRQSQKLAALGVMAGGIAHEIRNPLAVCSSAAQFLQEADLPADFREECAEKIQTGIQKVSTIIENLLRFSRPSAITETVSVNLNAVLNESLTLINNQAKVQNIALENRFSCADICICGVPSLLQQVFMNLCLNAIKAMPEGGTLFIELKKSDGEAVISVEDTGIGIPEANIDKIFDPFHTTSPVGNGTGLGLSICYSIVKQHRGSITVESQSRKGSVFTVKLPLP